MNTIVTQLTNEQLSDILCSAFEGGSNYWASIAKVVEPNAWLFNSDPGRHWAFDYPLNPGGAVLISDGEEVRRLDSESLQKGLAVLAERYAWHYADILAENADADTGDALLQCCLFGEIIYG